MKKCLLLLMLVLISCQDITARPHTTHRKPKQQQVFSTASQAVSSFLTLVNGVVTAVFSAQRDMVDNFLRRTGTELSAASGFMSDVLEETQHTAEALDYIRDDFLLSGASRRIGRKKKTPHVHIPTVPLSFNKIFLDSFKTVSGVADDKLRMLLQMSSNTGKLVADTTKQISKVLKAAEKFTKKVEKQKDKFDDKVTKEKLKLIETTKKSLSKFLKELSKISKHASHSKDSSKARVLLEAENELIDVTRESFNDILTETARGIARADNMHHKPKPKKPKQKKIKKEKPPKKETSVNHDEKSNLIARMLNSASEKIKVFAKLTKNISKAIEKASKQKRKAQKKIKKEIKKVQKAKKKIKKKTHKDVNKILKDGETSGVAHDNPPSEAGSFNSTLEGEIINGNLLMNENGTDFNVTTVKPSTTTVPPGSEEDDDDEVVNEEEIDEETDEEEDSDDDDDEEDNEIDYDEDEEDNEEQDDEEQDGDDDEAQDDEEDVDGEGAREFIKLKVE